MSPAETAAVILQRNPPPPLTDDQVVHLRAIFNPTSHRSRKAA